MADKKAEFREYLESSGAIDIMTRSKYHNNRTESSDLLSNFVFFSHMFCVFAQL